MEQPTNLRSLFTAGNSQRHELDLVSNPSSLLYQENLSAAIATFEECRKFADRLSIFSPNETEDDVSSEDLQYFLIDYFLGELLQKVNTAPRKFLLQTAQAAYERFLKRLDTYDMLSKSDSRLYERYSSNPADFSLMPSSDPVARRDIKISRFKHEKELKLKLEYLAQVPLALQNDDAAIREIHLAEIQLCTHTVFHALDMIGQELKIIALMPQTSPAPQPDDQAEDNRQQNGMVKDGYSDRLDLPLSDLLNKGKVGPILSKDGKPLTPFTLLDSRQRLRDGVFRQDHALPTMTIEEYLREEKQRGGIIDGGGPQSTNSQVIDEDDMERADAETLKAREWDDYVEANPKGSGNILNRG